MLILTIFILLILAVISFFYFSYNIGESISIYWLDQTGVLPQAWIPYLIGLLILILLAAWILSLVFSVPGRLRRSGNIRSMNKSRSSLDRGLMEIQSGEFETGEASLTSYLEGKPADAVKYMVAAKSAVNRGAVGQAETYLKKASDVSNSSGNAVRLAQAEMLLKKSEFKDAETLLTTLNKTKPFNAHILLQLATALEGTGNAKRLSEVTRIMRAKTAIPKEQIAGFEKFAWTKLINDADETELVNTYEALPKESRRNEHVVAAYAERLMLKGDHERASNTLQQAIHINWSEELVSLYGRIAPGESNKQLDLANSWQSKHPKSPAVAMTIGRLSASKKLWGKAKDSMIRAAQLDLNPEVCNEIGEILTSMGDTRHVKDCFQSAAALAIGKAPVGVFKDLDTLVEQLKT